MDTQTIKKGDFVRLTDPLSNGQIVRIESVDEHGFASWLGGSQNCDMEQISIVKNGSPIGNDIDGYYFSLSEIVQEVEKRVNGKEWLKLEKPFKLYPESAVEYWKHHAETAEKSNALNEKLLNKEHNKLLDIQDNIEKLQSELSRCRAANADYLTAKTEAENMAKILKKEVDDLKVPESRQNRHLRDELRKVRIECQQAFEVAEKERKENAELRMKVKGYISHLNKTAEAASYFIEKYEDIKRQLDESKQDILTLVNLIPCDEGNESIINDIKNLLKL